MPFPWPLGRGRSTRIAAPSKRLSFESLEARRAMTVRFLFDYSLDSAGFFNDSARRSALVQAGHMLADRFDDTLTAITPSGSNRWTPAVLNPANGSQVNVSRTTIPADTIVVYAGARNLPAGTLAIGATGAFSATGSQAWFNTIKARGQSGALASTPTDVGPWGGSLTFDSSGVNWNFSTTSTGLVAGKTDFISVAMHELGHIMGLGLSGSWNRLVRGSTFVGSTASARNGGPVPLESNRAHMKEGLKNQKMEVAMDPSLTTGTRKFFSNLDFAALVDIGWKTTGRDDTIQRAPHVLTRRSSDTNPSDTTTISNSLSFNRDVDLLRIYADAGMQLTVSSATPNGGRAVDTYLRIFSATGQELANGNQAGAGGTDRAVFNVTRSDYYYVGVSSATGRTYNPYVPDTAPVGPTGDYRMTITLQNQSGVAGATAPAALPADYYFAALANSLSSTSESERGTRKRAAA